MPRRSSRIRATTTKTAASSENKYLRTTTLVAGLREHDEDRVMLRPKHRVSATSAGTQKKAVAKMKNKKKASSKRSTSKRPSSSKSKQQKKSVAPRPTAANDEGETENENEKEDEHEHDDAFVYEFGGPFGAVSTTIALPLVCYGFAHFCDAESCPNMGKVSELIADPMGSASMAMSMLLALCTTQGFAVVFGWFAFQIVLERVSTVFVVVAVAAVAVAAVGSAAVLLSSVSFGSVVKFRVLIYNVQFFSHTFFSSIFFSSIILSPLSTVLTWTNSKRNCPQKSRWHAIGVQYQWSRCVLDYRCLDVPLANCLCMQQQSFTIFDQWGVGRRTWYLCSSTQRTLSTSLHVLVRSSFC
jgi:hypothetical protein